MCDNSGQDHFRVGFLAFAVPPFTTDLQSLMQIICNEKFDGHSRKALIRIISNIFSQLNYGACSVSSVDVSEVMWADFIIIMLW